MFPETTHAGLFLLVFLAKDRDRHNI